MRTSSGRPSAAAGILAIFRPPLPALSWLPPLAVLKGAGAGLVLGLLGVRPLGIDAAIGLILFFTGALTAHARAFDSIAVPGAHLALAAAAALAIAH